MGVLSFLVGLGIASVFFGTASNVISTAPLHHGVCMRLLSDYTHDVYIIAAESLQNCAVYVCVTCVCPNCIPDRRADQRETPTNQRVQGERNGRKSKMVELRNSRLCWQPGWHSIGICTHNCSVALCCPSAVACHIFNVCVSDCAREPFTLRCVVLILRCGVAWRGRGDWQPGRWFCGAAGAYCQKPYTCPCPPNAQFRAPQCHPTQHTNK